MNQDQQRLTQEFSRFEFKYVLNEKLKKKIEEQIQQFMKYDGFAHSEYNNSYFVRSLYFDSPSSFNFYEKIDGVKKRKKFRLRTYGKKIDESPLFMEQKGRNVNRVFKHRTLIEKDDIDSFYDAFHFEKLSKSYGSIKLINELSLIHI